MMIWDSIYFFLNSTIGSTPEALDVMVKRLKNELNTAITNLQTGFDNNHAGYKALFEEYETPGSYHINVPYGAKKVRVTANAGGGGAGTTNGRNGGIGASITNKEYTVTDVSHFILTVGAGGTNAGFEETVGHTGGSTIIGSFATLLGGGGSGSSNGTNGTGGDGAVLQSSLNYTERGKGAVRLSSGGDEAAKPGFARLEWIF